MVTTIPGLGPVTQDGDWLVSEPRYLPALDKQCRFLIDGYEPEESAGLVACVEAFTSLTKAELDAAAEPVFAYYRDVEEEVGTEPGFPRISGPANVWNFVTFADDVWLERDGSTWFVVLENECAWEPEHGLMLVFRDGRQVTKVSQYDGHLTNRHAFADDSIPEQAVYWNPSTRP